MRHYFAQVGLIIVLTLLAIAVLGPAGALLAVAPIVVRNPVLTLQELAAGVPTGTAVDVSDDVSTVELEPDVPTDDITTFSGTYQTAGDATWSGSVTIVRNLDTYANWDALVGKSVRAKLYDKGADMTRYRQFDTEVIFNPGLGGSTEPGEASSFDMALPILSDVTYVEP